MIDENNFHIINYEGSFTRNKDHNLLFTIINEDREANIKLNKRYNIIYITFIAEITLITKNIKPLVNLCFGVSYELLDLLFNKYKDNNTIIKKLVQFCLTSKSKSYWVRLKQKTMAAEVMAIVLGENKC